MRGKSRGVGGERIQGRGIRNVEDGSSLDYRFPLLQHFCLFSSLRVQRSWNVRFPLPNLYHSPPCPFSSPLNHYSLRSPHPHLLLPPLPTPSENPLAVSIPNLRSNRFERLLMRSSKVERAFPVAELMQGKVAKSEMECEGF